MFLKPIKVKSQTQLKSSAKRQFIGRVKSCFRHISNEVLDSILSVKGEIVQAKVQTANEQHVVVFMVNSMPFFFEWENYLLPTCHALFIYPDFLIRIATHKDVFSFLKNGADLMLPGVIGMHIGIQEPKVTYSNNNNELGTTLYRLKLAKGTPCSVYMSGNGCPMAIGIFFRSSEDMYLAGLKGKGVTILHLVDDHLFNLKQPKSKLLIPELEDPLEEFAADALVENENLEKLEIEEKVENEEEKSTLSTLDQDELLNSVLKHAIKLTLKRSQLPISISNFYTKHMQRCYPNLDMKKSSYKKLSKFMENAQKMGFLELKQLEKGVDSVITVAFDHEELRSFEANDEIVAHLKMLENAENEAVALKNASKYHAPDIVDVFLVNKNCLPFLEMINSSICKGFAFTRAELRKFLTSYIHEEKLNTESSVQLTPSMISLLRKKDEDLVDLKWDELFARFESKLEPGYQITFTGEEPIIRKGKLKQIDISVVQRASNKKVTILRNLDLYGIELKTFAHQLQVTVAGSANVFEDASGSGVMVQGQQIKVVSDLLCNKMGLPKKYVNGLDLKVKKK